MRRGAGRLPALLLALGGGLLVAAQPAVSAGRQLMTLWTIEEGAAPSDVRELRSGDYVMRQRLLPLGLAELTEGTATAGLPDVEQGSQLIELQGGDAAVFCDPVIRPKKLIGHAQLCLVDADRDSRFEGMFLTTSVTKGILTIQGKRPKSPRAIPPVAYRRVDPANFKADLFVGLQYRGNANLLGNHIFEVRYGSAERTGSLSKRIAHKKAEIHGSREFMGGRFTILDAFGETIRVRIDKPMPAQPFGVLQTTTYRFY